MVCDPVLCKSSKKLKRKLKVEGKCSIKKIEFPISLESKNMKSLLLFFQLKKCFLCRDFFPNSIFFNEVRESIYPHFITSIFLWTLWDPQFIGSLILFSPEQVKVNCIHWVSVWWPPLWAGPGRALVTTTRSQSRAWVRPLEPELNPGHGERRV